MKTKLPPNFYSSCVHLFEAFREVADRLGDTRTVADQLIRLLPLNLKSSPAFLLRLTGQWCYEFGDLFDKLPNGKVVFGSEQFPEVEYLYRGLRASERYFSNVELLSYLKRLSNPSKHMETLGELAPLVRIRDDVAPKYEVKGYGEGNRTIDWLFTLSSEVPVLLDVKYRVKDIVTQFGKVILRPGADVGEIPTPDLDPAWLFKDTVEKFRPETPDRCLQGIWIHLHLKQEESALINYFNSLDAGRLHFAILCRWRKESYMLSRQNVDRKLLKKLFDLEESMSFVFTKDSV